MEVDGRKMRRKSCGVGRQRQMDDQTNETIR
jgi:hypothetical protein